MTYASVEDADDLNPAELDLDRTLAVWAKLNELADQDSGSQDLDELNPEPPSLILMRARARIRATRAAEDIFADVVQLESSCTTSSEPEPGDTSVEAAILEWPTPKDAWTLEALLQRVANRKHPAAADWTWIGVTISVGIFIAASIHAWPVAALLLVTRVTGSLWIGGGPLTIQPPMSAVAQDTTVETFGSPSRAVWGCFASHLCDVAIVLACGVSLLPNHPNLAFLTASAAIVALLGTLARLAPSQVAVVVRRSPWERVFRVGGMLIGFVVGSSSHHTAAPIIVATPAALFGTWELLKMFSNRRTNEIASLYVAGFSADGTRIHEATYHRPATHASKAGTDLGDSPVSDPTDLVSRIKKRALPVSGLITTGHERLRRPRDITG